MASKNKSDYIFALGYGSPVVDGGCIALITPRDYFAKHGFMYDQHLPFDVPGWYDLMEGVFEPGDPQADPAALVAGLTAQGFTWDKKFSDFAKSSDLSFSLMWEPGVFQTLSPDGEPPVIVVPVPSAKPVTATGSAFFISHVAVAAPACISGGGKVDTALCKQAITEMVKANPGLVSKDFYQPSAAEIAQMDVDASKEKNWKRRDKGKICGGLTDRTFDCVPFDDQLRAHVWDDGKRIVKISIQGE